MKLNPAGEISSVQSAKLPSRRHLSDIGTGV